MQNEIQWRVFLSYQQLVSSIAEYKEDLIFFFSYFLLIGGRSF